MPIPFLLGGAAVLAGVIGASSHKDAKETNEKAERISRNAQSLYNASKKSLEDSKNKAEKTLLKLGYEKKNVLDGSMKQFVQVYDRIKNIQIKESSGLNEISSFSIEQQDIVQIQKMSDIYSDSVQSGAAGAATGVMIALAASGSLPMVTGALSLAGTCLSLGSIGAAASIAGTAITTAITATPLAAIAAPVVFFTGVSASMKADENLEKAETVYAEAEKAAEEMKVSETLCTAIGKRAEMFDELLVKLNAMFSDSINMLYNVIEEKDKLHGKSKIKAEDLTSKEIELIAVTRALAGAVKAVIDTPILTKEGAVSKESLDVYNSTQKSIPQFSNMVVDVKKVNEKKEKNGKGGIAQRKVESHKEGKKIPDQPNSKVEKCLFTIDQVRQNMSEVYYQYFGTYDMSEKNWLNCFIVITSILYAIELVNYNIISRFIFLQQDKEIVYSLSSYISNGVIDKKLANFMSALSKDELIKIVKVANLEMEYIDKYVSDEVKNKIEERFASLLMK